MSDNSPFERQVSPTRDRCLGPGSVETARQARSHILLDVLVDSPLNMLMATMMRLKRHELTGDGAVFAISAAIAVMFMGSTLVTPLYVLYQQAFGFSEVTLTLVYAAYVVGNLCALLFFGRLSDRIGRRRTTLPAMRPR